MKKPSLQHLIRLQRNNEWIKEYANELANQLMIDFDVNEGYRVAGFLKVSQGLDNYTAIRVWTEKWLKQKYPVSDDDSLLEDLKNDDTLYPKLKAKFFSHFPGGAVA